MKIIQTIDDQLSETDKQHMDQFYKKNNNIDKLLPQIPDIKL